ncbi:trithorax group protein osa isoform X2 [Phymastichus coffea]|uniref:trithorax group protein osa isoform X2 n=1 Tax=Phymastichus coffea TaxID=108790 RepID=UPI00273C0357|nr:trithorax group protein osa isoform X2 [Phymastichus coffea]
MSQYRPEDAGGNPGSEVKSPREIHQNNSQLDVTVKTETQDTIVHVTHSFSNQIRSDFSEEYVSKISASDYPRQSRFSSSSQNITQPTGPTPTLNQLLQATSSPGHRFHNNYSSIGSESYQQSWQRSPVMSPIYSQSTQRPTQMLTSYGITSGHNSNLYPEQRNWNQVSNTSISTLTNQMNTSNQSPQRALSQSPAPPTASSPQPQSSAPQSFHGLQQRSTTPNTQGLDSGELSGQNSNDSSNGPAGPATPTSQGMRPTPSPTGSTGSRSMSPAVGQQSIQIPPRPSSNQSDNSNPTRLSLSPLTNQGYETTSGSSVQAHPYKINTSGQSTTQGSSPQSNTNSTSGGPVYANTSNPGNSYGSQGNYPNLRPHLQFPPMVNNQYQSGRSNISPQYSTYPHKMNFNSVSTGLTQNLVSPQVYSTAGNMGPPAMGPPPISQSHINQLMHSNTTSLSENPPMPPPNSSSSSPNLYVESALNIESQNDMGNTTTTLATVSATSNSTSVTSVITTGPDGTSLDEGSQQSTLSNASAASGEDSAFTSKVRKDLMSYHSHPATPSSTIPSPGTGSINSIHEDYSEINSPGWPRTPVSPVYNSQLSHDPYRSKKSDSLSKLYEMDDSIERRSWLDKLVNFMEDRRTPITSCPTISKNPLDLFRLYLYVKERGGFMEVTKNKTWKDIAGLLGIGASSSAAYTLRKHYTKHLLAYECHFDRGGVDPQPIINQVEAGSKKKGTKGTASVPSPGSSNSQDSFPPGTSNNASIESYGNYQNSYSSNTGNGSNGEFSSTSIRPSNQNNTASHQVGAQQGNYQSSAPFQSYAQDQYIRQGSTATQSNEFPSYNSRAHYSSYTSDNDRNYPGNNLASTNSGNQELYNRYSGNQQGSSYSNVTSPGSRNYPAVSQGHSVNIQQSVTTQQTSQSQSNSVPTYTCTQDFYRQDQSPYGSTLGNQLYPGANNKSMPPPPPSSQQPRRHPDFAKDQQYSPYNQQRPSYAGWSSGSSQYSTGNNIRLQYSNQQSQSPQQQHSQTQGIINTSVSSVTAVTSCQQWNNQPSRSSPQGIINPIVHNSPSWDHRCNQSSSSVYPSTGSQQNQHGISSSINQQSITKREMTFPVESIEAVSPLLYKRRKISRTDVAPVEAWRIMMALRSGLLAESCWALDVLNILLFDDTSIHYFGLTHLPGLLDILLEHFSRSLSDMFDSTLIEKNRFYERQISNLKIDLGAVTNSIRPEDCIKLISCSNYTLLTRKGRSVKFVPRDDDIFILDDQRAWDIEYTESDVEPWQIDSKTINYIVTCFETEVRNISFSNYSNEETNIIQKKLSKEQKDDFGKNEMDINKHIEACNNNSHDVVTFGFTSVDDKHKCIEPRQLLDKKKKSKTLSDVLLRIKKVPIEMSEITKELFEKKHDNTKKDIIIMSPNSIYTDQSNKSPSSYNNGIFSSSPQIDTGSTKSFMYNQTENKKVIIPAQSEDQTIKSQTFRNNLFSKISKDYIVTEDEIKLKIKDPSGTLKRRNISDYEDESYSRDEASLYLITETQDNLARRCVCLSTILRNLTFIPGNETEFAKNITFLSLLGKLLLLYHDHPVRTQKTRNYDREEDADFVDSCSSLQGETEWWWDFLYHIRENVLVMAANIAGHIDLSQYSEEISRPVLDGLLHWAVCPAAHGQDPFPTVNVNSSLSPQRLALEALCKLCVTESNVDLVVATPPFSRLQKLCSVLSRLLCRSEEQVLREFGVNLLHFLSAADSGVARTIALQTPCIALLVAFIEQAENNALTVANQHGIAALRENPESMGTSLDMLRRAAGTLLHLSRHPDNKALLLQHESRLLALVMSQILDQQVAAIVARVLFQCSRATT